MRRILVALVTLALLISAPISASAEEFGPGGLRVVPGAVLVAFSGVGVVIGGIGCSLFVMPDGCYRTTYDSTMAPAIDFMMGRDSNLGSIASH